MTSFKFILLGIEFECNSKLQAEMILAGDLDLDTLDTCELIDLWGWLHGSDKFHRLMPLETLKPHKLEVIAKIREQVLASLEKNRLDS